eukprot:CAMPEP_0175489972 /NCGR_PEP_ID=MMETSP0096-20121207/1020_1 /TAXON_ID=311494 /ORGANISM="Alexandrium monilatum, Strain CCMP3105" /LENGTH=91 /DNA_ID=CAMNT_0016791877 /DNA_START=327 /DNA_END=599 /DNA_ORIENTATION=-
MRLTDGLSPRSVSPVPANLLCERVEYLESSRRVVPLADASSQPVPPGNTKSTPSVGSMMVVPPSLTVVCLRVTSPREPASAPVPGPESSAA